MRTHRIATGTGAQVSAAGHNRKRKAERISRSLAVLGAAGALTAATAVVAPAAHADGSVCNPGCTSSVEFQSYGEVLTVHDYAANGKSTVALLDLNRDGTYTAYWNTNGYSGPPAVFDLELAEGIPLRYKACEGYSSTGTIVNCGNWFNDGS